MSLSKIPNTVWALGFVSLFMDISSEAVHGLLPGFLVFVLGANMISVGFLEGLSEGLALIVKFFSGVLSDKWKKRKSLVLIGYFLGALSKPFFAISASVTMVYTARLFDRFGKGLRGAPRDAIIADVTPIEIRGQAYGLRQSLDTIGAFLGPLLAMAFMFLFNGNFRIVFWLAAIPGFIAVLLLFITVQEPERQFIEKTKNKGIEFSNFHEFQTEFWLILSSGLIFQMARFSEAFLILRANEVGLSSSASPLVLIIMNFIYALIAFPVGWLSDRFQKKYFLWAGLLILIFADLVLANSTHLIGVILGVLLWGIHLGLTQGTLSALVANHSPNHLRGTAFGLFNLVSALALIIGGLFAGWLWEKNGSRFTFYFSALFSLCSLIIFYAITKKQKLE